MKNLKYDAIVVGSGPNGLAAAITLQQKGVQVLLIEGKETTGGGMRTAQLTLPGFHHDICSAIHPLAVSSPFFKGLPLQDHGLQFVQPKVLAAHPFRDGTDAALYTSLEKTVKELGVDGKKYASLLSPILKNWENLVPELLGPLRIPKHPFLLASFGLKAIQPANFLANNRFTTEKAKGLWAGMAAHAIQPLSNWASSAIALVLLAAGHHKGWPIPVGGSQAIANAMSSYFEHLGGRIETGNYVNSLSHLPDSKAILLDITPKQLVSIAGDRLSSFYKWQLGRYKYGIGVFKMDWALDGPIPFISKAAREAGTVHLGGTLDEIGKAEALAWKGKYTDNPYMLVAQQSLYDSSRAPEGKHTAWAYCHVPSGSTEDLTQILENQIEKYAPGFKKLILARHTMNTREMQAYNPNYLGGDINGGVQDITQIFTRPALRRSPYRTSAKGIYICSSSTPPGGGVHGMCGYHAADRAWKDIFK